MIIGDSSWAIPIAKLEITIDHQIAGRGGVSSPWSWPENLQVPKWQVAQFRALFRKLHKEHKESQSGSAEKFATDIAMSTGLTTPWAVIFGEILHFGCHDLEGNHSN